MYIYIYICFKTNNGIELTITCPKTPPGRSVAFRAAGRGGATPCAAVGRLLERQGGPDGVLGGGKIMGKLWENYGKI